MLGVIAINSMRASFFHRASKIATDTSVEVTNEELFVRYFVQLCSTRCRSTLQVLYTNSTKEQFISFISKNNQYYKKIHLTTINLKIRSKKYTMSHNTPLSKGSSDATQLHDMLLQKNDRSGATFNR